MRHKLASYSLDMTHEDGGPKARGFQRILGITVADVDYLETAILDGILMTPVSSMQHNPPYGFNCEVGVPVRGVGERSGRTIDVRTIWEIAGRGAPPRLVSAYLKP